MPKLDRNADQLVHAFPTFSAALAVWLKVGCLSFGGPAGQIALLHREVVEERHWIGEHRFLQALNFCTLLPGPEAQQLATYLGWLMHGVRGGLAAGILFVLPGAAVMLALSLIYATLGKVPSIDALFFGLKCAVLMLVVEALVRIGRRALHGRASWIISAGAFAALFVFGVPFPIVVLAAGVVGYLLPTQFVYRAHSKSANDADALLDAVLAADPDRPKRLATGAFRAGSIALAAWTLPVLALMYLAPGTYADVAFFFSKMAVVTLGGAYAVLAYVAQDAVQSYHWLSPQEMLAGLGLAETTPGPLILVLQFVGFLAGYRSPTGMTGIPGGLAASALVLWVTFAPCFAFVFLGAPFIERLQHNQALSSALAAVTAAVVGVIANLALWFGLRVLFRSLHPVAFGPLHVDLPIVTSLDPSALALALLSALCLFGLKLGVLRTLGIAAGGGLLIHLAN